MQFNNKIPGIPRLCSAQFGHYIADNKDKKKRGSGINRHFNFRKIFKRFKNDNEYS